jgi:hypothetical protein
MTPSGLIKEAPPDERPAALEEVERGEVLFGR